MPLNERSGQLLRLVVTDALAEVHEQALLRQMQVDRVEDGLGQMMCLE